MQRTANYNLPQFESTDVYSLSDYNIAYQTIDTTMKTNATDIAGWNTFKNSGGSIQNTLTVKKSGDPYITVDDTATGYKMSMHTDVTTGFIHFFDSNFNVISGIDFKSDGIYFGAYSKATNGYTKLPNGMILQWGLISLGGVDANNWSKYFNLPIAFPNAFLNVTASIIPQDSITNARTIASYVVANNLNQIYTRGQKLGLPYEDSIAQTYIQWIAIGH